MPPKVAESKTLLDFQIQPDIVVVYKQRKTSVVIDEAIPTDSNIV